MSPEAPLRNVLDEETSPYLRQHKDNPVHWQVWNAETLKLAQDMGRPILLSVGYSACHWCHVMAHESFEEDDVAAVMNELFINIKVDREERPDVDNTYQSALALMGEQGGWPLTMFLTPEGDPFWGGTYFPPSPRWGRPGFKDVLGSVRRTYDTAPDKIQSNVRQLGDALKRLSRQQGEQGFPEDALTTAAEQAIRYVDFRQGGTLGAPKFPQPTFFAMLWRGHWWPGDLPYGQAVTLTLEAMVEGGIYDHLGGGFARYSTDDDWLVPHFEKMLYDNALLVELMSDVWLETGSDLLNLRVRETIDWMIRDLAIYSPHNPEAFGLAAAYDADSEGVEGKFYVWSDTEIDAILGDDAGPFKAAYDVTKGGNWEGSTILNRSHNPGLKDGETEAALSVSRARLLAEREKRIPPGRDDKVLADWNGMTAHALVRAGLAFNRADWLSLAEDLLTFVADHHRPDGRLCHAWCAGEAAHPAVIDDLAHLGRAALALHCATGKASWLNTAEDLIAEANQHYWDDQDGGYFLSADDTLDVRHRAKTALDNAVPSGNGVMADLLARAWLVTGKDSYRERLDALLKAFSGAGKEQWPHLTLLLMATETASEAMTVVLTGTTDQAHPLIRTALEKTPNHAVVQLVPGPDNLADDHPAKAKAAQTSQVAAFVCRRGACSLPVTDPGELASLLAGA